MDNGFADTLNMVRKLGGGGEGDVYLAWDKSRSQYIAVKRVKKQVLGSLLEAEILRDLDYPGLPRLIGVFTEKDSVCLAMDYIPGITLKEYIKRHGKVSERRAVLWGIQLCSILCYLHGRNPPVIHCDIKPGNLMVTKEGNLTLIDFGTAKLGKEGNKRQGTRGYAPPEQMDASGQVDQQSDIYSLGMTLYHLSTGNRPSENPWAGDEDYGLSDGFLRVLRGCIRPEKKDRFLSAEEVKKRLIHLKRRHVRIRCSAAAVCSAVMVILYMGFGERKDQQLYSRYLSMAGEEAGKTRGRYSSRAVRYYEMAIEEEPGSASAYGSLLRYFQSVGKEKEGLQVLAEFIEAKDFSAAGKDELLLTVGEMYLQGKEGEGGYSPDPVLAHRYLSMQQDPSGMGQAYTEIAYILAGGSYQAAGLKKTLEKLGQEVSSFRQLYFLYRTYEQKRQELKPLKDVDKVQQSLVQQMEEKAESTSDKRTVLREKAAFYERAADRYGLDPWLEAADQYINVMDREEDRADMQRKKARMLAEHKRKKEAEEVYESLISRYPRDTVGYIEYGFYLAREGRKDMAYVMYRRAQQLGAGQDTEFQRLGAILGEGSES